MKLDFSARKPVTGAVEIVGSRETLDTAALAGATYPVASVASIFAGAMVGSLAIVGVSPAPIVRQLSLEVSNGIAVGHDVGSLYGQPLGAGRCTVTGSVSAYFTAAALYQAALDHAAGAITFTVGTTPGQKYTLSLPAVRLLDGAMVMGGRNDDLIATIPYQGRFASSIGATLSITRNVT